MQFIINGPDIPNELLRAHEEGRVVFFCGAGISYPAGLPSFKDLVDQIYSQKGATPDELENRAIEQCQFDTALDLFERRLPGQRQAIRKVLVDILEPNLQCKGAMDTHTALLQLAQNKEGVLRLVTTNFDSLFHKAAEKVGQNFQAYAAPMLPIPKNSHWDGLVYLHGLLPNNPSDSDLNRLVITSGDFGLAYLVERWAARFVSELFHNYVVCFVGYSLNDPVLRYMMDALAADRMLGEVTPKAWALGDCSPGQERSKRVEWETKGVTPILYEVPDPDSVDHSALHKTLKAWAGIYRDGTLGKERIVASHALTQPSKSTQQDDFVGRVLWALSDSTGLPARRFAELNPAPSLDWLLSAFSDERFECQDLMRFGVPSRERYDDKLRFSMIYRPAPYHCSPYMQLVSGGAMEGKWDNVMDQLARWLVRHLGDARLVIWVAQRGGRLHSGWVDLIEYELGRIAKLECDGKAAELDIIRLHAPKAIPSPLMRKLWRLLLSGRVKSLSRDGDLYRWVKRFKWEGLTTMLRLELRELLTPKVLLKKPVQWGEPQARTSEPTRIKQLVHWELTLAADHAPSALNKLADEDQWISALPHLLEDFQGLLRDALDLSRELEGPEQDDFRDQSCWDLPSISTHKQNRGFHTWVTLIEWVREAWLAVQRHDSVRAKRIAEGWFELPYPTFKRLAFFAATKESIAAELWVDWLLTDCHGWLWAYGTKREVLRLLVLRGKELTGVAQKKLEAAILAGPPHDIYRDDLEPDQRQHLVSRSVWLYLAKLASSGLGLSAIAQARLDALSGSYSQWQLATNERDEFSYWVSGINEPDYQKGQVVDVFPRKRREIVAWLKRSQLDEQSFFHEDLWPGVCRTRFFHSFCALTDLSHDGRWPSARWKDALQVWSEEDVVLRSWRYAAPIVQGMPDNIFQELIHSVTWWIESASKAINQHEEILLNLCDRTLRLPLEAGLGDEDSDLVNVAINHPVGHVTKALINLWFKKTPNDNDELSEDIEPLFTKICDVKEDRFRHGRVLLGSQLIALFRVDRHWTEQYILPLLAWGNLEEAKAIWEGFFMAPRLYPPLMGAFKVPFLECAGHYHDLGGHSQQFAAFLTYVALEATEGYTEDEYKSAIGALPQEGLEEVAKALTQALEGAADQREDYWRSRVLPFWKSAWPKSNMHATPAVAKALAGLIIAAGSEFSAALTAIHEWLKPIEYPDYVVGLLRESGACTRFPEDALKLLSALIGYQDPSGKKERYLAEELRLCLIGIAGSSADLERNCSYKRLFEYYRQHS